LYQIVICDDEEIQLLYLEKLLKANQEFGTDCCIRKFTSGVDFLEDKEKRTDLLILDMAMPGMSGYETALELRKTNPKAVLAFCSSTCTPKPEHFEVQPYRYILKPQPGDKVSQTLTELLQEMRRVAGKKHLEASADGKAFFIDIDEILYLEKLKRGTGVIVSEQSVLYQQEQRLCIRENLKELEETLCEEGFVKPHSSYLVNMRRIKAVDNQEIVLENGERMSITRSCKETFHKVFSEYFGKKYRRESK